MSVNGDTGEIDGTYVTPLITTKLFNESLDCPIAFTELVRQYGELSDTQRVQWADSLTGAQAASIYFASVMHADGLGALMLAIAGFDVNAGQHIVETVLDRIGAAFGFTVQEGDPIPDSVRTAAMEYALSI